MLGSTEIVEFGVRYDWSSFMCYNERVGPEWFSMIPGDICLSGYGSGSSLIPYVYLSQLTALVHSHFCNWGVRLDANVTKRFLRKTPTHVAISLVS
jgi:hypothetical protein